MTNLKKMTILATVALTTFISTVFLWNYKIWPFSTGSSISAFLGTTFEMSLPEVQRKLRESGVQLVDKTTFVNLASTPQKRFLLAEYYSGSIFYNDETSRWFMLSTNIFDAQVIAAFIFDKNKLVEVEIEFFPFKNESSDIVNDIENKLIKKCPTLKRSKKTPGTYRVNCEINSEFIELWVDFDKPNEPIITLEMVYKPATQKKSENIESF